MADGGEVAPAPGKARVRKVHVRWSEALGERLCARLAAGEMLYRILKEPGMPTPEGVMKWAKSKPEFGAAFAAARKAGGRPSGSRGPVSTYSEAVAQEIFERVCEGESLISIGADPTMPSVSTIFNWRDHFPDFEALMQRGMRVRAERFCDRGWEIAERDAGDRVPGACAARPPALDGGGVRALGLSAQAAGPAGAAGAAAPPAAAAVHGRDRPGNRREARRKLVPEPRYRAGGAGGRSRLAPGPRHTGVSRRTDGVVRPASAASSAPRGGG